MRKQEYRLIMVLPAYKQAYEQVRTSTSNGSFLSRTGNVLHAFLSPRSDLEVSLVQWQGKAGWDVPALYLDIREETPVWP